MIFLVLLGADMMNTTLALSQMPARARRLGEGERCRAARRDGDDPRHLHLPRLRDGRARDDPAHDPDLLSDDHGARLLWPLAVRQVDLVRHPRADGGRDRARASAGRPERLHHQPAREGRSADRDVQGRRSVPAVGLRPHHAARVCFRSSRCTLFTRSSADAGSRRRSHEDPQARAVDGAGRGRIRVERRRRAGSRAQGRALPRTAIRPRSSSCSGRGATRSARNRADASSARSIPRCSSAARRRNCSTRRRTASSTSSGRSRPTRRGASSSPRSSSCRISSRARRPAARRCGSTSRRIRWTNSRAPSSSSPTFTTARSCTSPTRRVKTLEDLKGLKVRAPTRICDEGAGGARRRAGADAGAAGARGDVEGRRRRRVAAVGGRAGAQDRTRSRRRTPTRRPGSRRCRTRSSSSR